MKILWSTWDHVVILDKAEMYRLDPLLAAQVKIKDPYCEEEDARFFTPTGF